MAQGFRSSQPPPPASRRLIADTARLMAINATSEATLAALLGLLTPLGYARKAVQAAFELAYRERVALPMAAVGVSTGPYAAYRRSLAKYRAAYLLSASSRLTGDLQRGVPVQTALRAEAAYYRRHQQASERRLQAVQSVVDAVAQHKDANGLLGWYSKMDGRTSAECRAANGSNFEATKGTVIGWPGAVHPYCRCKAGPAHATMSMVDDAVRGILAVGEKALA